MKYRYLMIIVVLVLIILNNFVIIFEVSGNSMEPTLENGSKVLCRRNLCKQKNLVKNSCIIFHINDTSIMYQDNIQQMDNILYTSKDFYIKRIVGIPTEKITIYNNNLYINDIFVCKCNIAVGNKEYIIPNGKYFVLGDNIDNSLDSRYYGLIDSNDIDYILY